MLGSVATVQHDYLFTSLPGQHAHAEDTLKLARVTLKTDHTHGTYTLKAGECMSVAWHEVPTLRHLGVID